MSDIKENDQGKPLFNRHLLLYSKNSVLTNPVSWKYCGGNLEAEIKTSGELAIETKGKQAKVHASEDNPAVHVAQNGSDAIRHKSALTKNADAAENSDSEATNQVDPDMKQNGQHLHDEPKSNKAESTPATSNSNATANLTEEPDQPEESDQPEEPDQPEDKMDDIPDPKKVKVGEKRGREDCDSGETKNNEEQGKQENGNISKKTKLDNGDAAENSHHTENGHTHNEHGNGVEAPVAEEERPKKTKGPGRHKKVDTEAKHAVSAEGDGSTIARRTRSKA